MKGGRLLHDEPKRIEVKSLMGSKWLGATLEKTEKEKGKCEEKYKKGRRRTESSEEREWRRPRTTGKVTLVPRKNEEEKKMEEMKERVECAIKQADGGTGSENATKNRNFVRKMVDGSVKLFGEMDEKVEKFKKMMEVQTEVQKNEGENVKTVRQWYKQINDKSINIDEFIELGVGLFKVLPRSRLPKGAKRFSKQEIVDEEEEFLDGAYSTEQLIDRRVNPRTREDYRSGVGIYFIPFLMKRMGFGSGVSVFQLLQVEIAQAFGAYLLKAKISDKARILDRVYGFVSVAAMNCGVSIPREAKQSVSDVKNCLVCAEEPDASERGIELDQLILLRGFLREPEKKVESKEEEESKVSGGEKSETSESESSSSESSNSESSSESRELSRKRPKKGKGKRKVYKESGAVSASVSSAELVSELGDKTLESVKGVKLDELMSAMVLAFYGMMRISEWKNVSIMDRVINEEECRILKWEKPTKTEPSSSVELVCNCEEFKEESVGVSEEQAETKESNLCPIHGCSVEIWEKVKKVAPTVINKGIRELFKRSGLGDAGSRQVSHLLRAGGAGCAASTGALTEEIMAYGRWKSSSSVTRYERDTRRAPGVVKIREWPVRKAKEVRKEGQKKTFEKLRECQLKGVKFNLGRGQRF